MQKCRMGGRECYSDPYYYIELNPVRAGMVNDPADYPWSSYRSNGLGVASSLLTPHAEYMALGQTAVDRQAAYRVLFRHALDDARVTAIRANTNSGLVFGGERFKDELETLLKRRMRPGVAGRPCKKEETGDADVQDGRQGMLL